ncbi:MAG TPA: N-acetylmuramoyl-L-alanine amidase [Candidatus Mediterraneibacter excrementavium]|nr:N-acetylmuramoyl-L-alanine amidase [Candidatus Mediterraneibacter excrementavium]
MKAAAGMLAVIMLIILCQILSLKLEKRIDNYNRTKETFKLSGDALIILDAGHGGLDSGKIGINDQEEKDINLKIALKIKKLLEEQGISVMMTRSADERLSETQTEDLKARTEIMNRSNAALAVSIHQNSFRDSSVSGAQVFYYPDSDEGRKAADAIQEELNDMQPDNRKEVKANDTYYILKNTEIPVVIVECGFLSNYTEAEKLADDSYQSVVAGTVVRGILQYIND